MNYESSISAESGNSRRYREGELSNRPLEGEEYSPLAAFRWLDKLYNLAGDEELMNRLLKALVEPKYAATRQRLDEIMQQSIKLQGKEQSAETAEFQRQLRVTLEAIFSDLKDAERL
ncbi:MAG TPA: hypothetical protein VHA30_00520 [Patescibacteria group bacterium]|nr:hypothetical protein [Patescibacteria group bacterium]